MATTHALVGLTLAALFAPEATPVVLAAGFAGGGFPDLDLYAGHRKTLHFPVYYSLAAVLAGGVYLVTPGSWTLAAAVFLFAAAVHSGMDAFGGGLELRPWEGTSDRGVYDHFRGTWIPPKRWVRYDGAPEDLAVAAVAALPELVLLDGQFDLLVYAALVVSTVYVAVRKPMVVFAEWLVARTPAGVLTYVPERFVADYR